ncbi:hypothetical protein GT370_07600 [Acidocella sp. MX-AZ03]|uniref:hypothetical protein n=1 Tax=Acidocella sp. MX-AZ03 TaxID=2697363 RepID=UPI0022DD1BC5|nr:hypothetical protein [Acidocella sp. MX-AZ03]WBO60625.1 hypothetical protein GT370_07600 [Acidocella sp. MX-AZ03]
MIKQYRTRATASAFALLGATALAAVSVVPARAADPSMDATQVVQKNFTPVPDFSPLVKAVMPAVVSVDVKLKLDQAADDSSSGPQAQNGLPPGFPQIPGFPPAFLLASVARSSSRRRLRPRARASSSMPTAPSSPITMW